MASAKLGMSEFKKWVLYEDGCLDTSTNTTIENLHHTTEKMIELDSDILDNSNSKTSRKMTVPQRTTRKNSSISVSSNQEFTFGQEISIEASGPEVPLSPSLKARLTATFGQKFSTTKTEINSVEKTITYGGGEQDVGAGKKLRISFAYKEITFSFTAKNKQLIKSMFPEDLLAVWINFWDGRKATPPVNYNDRKTPFEIFSLIYEKKDNLATANLCVHYRKNNNSYILPTYLLRDLIEIDYKEKKVYLKGSSAVFQGAYGDSIVQTISDVVNGQVLSCINSESGEYLYSLDPLALS
ncbi:hypothetical protein [Pseudomonas sessilinigenes]|uniref:Uncharacterized protein n=1 Tax=Pseudomonas sessilinigenes TaxID=658629 RepID=A0ABX8MI77_9PSED|nr:hypothetical protein [Pseudomonas sessilinigenes]AZC27039.1 hypothetical protein C4K39_5396 [Pseudomonas sessilinigenes]QXH39006.1 hypothetical protein KSS89_22570 [Pseudomonas sessilinigenes]